MTENHGRGPGRGMDSQLQERRDRSDWEMVQWDTEDDKCDVYYVIIDDLSWENGGSRHDSERI